MGEGDCFDGDDWWGDFQAAPAGAAPAADLQAAPSGASGAADTAPLIEAEKPASATAASDTGAVDSFDPLSDNHTPHVSPNKEDPKQPFNADDLAALGGGAEETPTGK